MKRYYSEVNDDIFFCENIVEKVVKLYNLFYGKFKYISAKCGNEMLGNDFNDELDKLPHQIYCKTYYHSEYNDIQISTFIEHKARLAILKSAIDYKLYKDTGEDVKAGNTLKQIGQKFHLQVVPDSFEDGLDKISKDKFFHRYPIFWQWFMWVFGGYILKDYEKKEYEILSQKTGIPPQEIPNALKSYETLFPNEKGWFMNLTNPNIRLIKMFSVPFMGVGARYRFSIYDSNNFKDIKLTQLYLNSCWKLTCEVVGKNSSYPKG